MSFKIRVYLLVAILTTQFILPGCNYFITQKDINSKFDSYESDMNRIMNDTYDPNKKLLLKIDSIANTLGEKGNSIRTKAYESQRISDDFVKYLNEIRYYFINKYGGRDEIGNLKEASNIEASTKYFLNPEDNQSKGKELMQKINSTRINLLNILEKKEQLKIKTELIAENNKLQGYPNWLEDTFKDMPLAVAFADLTRFENDAKKLNFEVLTVLADNLVSENK